MYTLYDLVKEEQERIHNRIIAIKKEIEKYPKENLICAKDRKNFKWYINDGNGVKILHKSERKKAQQLAMRKYLLRQLYELIQDEKACDLYLKQYEKEIKKADRMLDDDSGYKELLCSNLKIMPPHSRDFSRELGGISCIL